jgi:hypothetical protein
MSDWAKNMNIESTWGKYRVHQEPVPKGPPEKKKKNTTWDDIATLIADPIGIFTGENAADALSNLFKM